MKKWIDQNKWFVLCVLSLLYLAHAFRYQSLSNRYFLDRWAGQMIRLDIARTGQPGRDMSSAIFAPKPMVTKQDAERIENEFMKEYISK